MPWYARSRSDLRLSLPLSALAAVASAAAALHCAPAAAQIRRCTDAHGNSVYTDRECSAVGGVDRLPRGAAQAQSPAQSGGGCARNLRDLVGQITQAIDAQDGNRLAAVYHWTGMSDDQAYAVMQRLDAIAHRPLLDIAPVLPAAPAPPSPEPGAWTTLPPPAPNAATAPLPPVEPPAPALASPLGRPSGAAAAEAEGEAAQAEPAVAGAGTASAAAAVAATPRRRAPVGLRLEQTLGNGITPSRTVFGLTRHFGCWWIKG